MSARTEAADLAHQQAETPRRVVVGLPLPSSTQQACVDAIQRDWAGRGAAFGTLEIRSVTTGNVAGDDVVTGEGRTLTLSAEASRSYTVPAPSAGTAADWFAAR